jgi:hypothetical protein
MNIFCFQLRKYFASLVRALLGKTSGLPLVISLTWFILMLDLAKIHGPRLFIDFLERRRCALLPGGSVLLYGNLSSSSSLLRPPLCLATFLPSAIFYHYLELVICFARFLYLRCSRK